MGLNLNLNLNWIKKDYFDSILHRNTESVTALEMLVDDLHLDREKTVSNFLCHAGSEDFLWALLELLSYKDVRVAGNAAYILGMLAESELGCCRILTLLKKNTSAGHTPLVDLLDMLLSDDAESVMNAAGTIGTLAETTEGRDWMIEDASVGQLLSRMAGLLESDNVWTASNAALVLARLTISLLGAGKLLNHDESQSILSKLIQALGLDEAGRGMNAAFAIGRLCDLDAGRSRLLEMKDSDSMISSLARMLSYSDTGASKNACFALSCLAATGEGHGRVVRACRLDEVMKTLASLLVCSDHETSWFAAMTLRTIASQPTGCLRLRAATEVVKTLKEVISDDGIAVDLRDEIRVTLEILKRLAKPSPPRVTVTGPETVEVEWDKVRTKSGLLVKYQLFEGARLVFMGRELSTNVGELTPCTQYTFRVRAFTEGDESPPSDNVLVTTEESVPSVPTQLRVIGATTTQLKLLWEPPEKLNGQLRGYYVYYEKKLFEHTQELTSIITGLSPGSEYEVAVCAATSKGKGPRAVATGLTSELGAHAPAKPTVDVRGRSELFISWEAPDNPLGKINRYDLTMNGRVVYSGTELNFTAHRLHPDTEYTFTVSALTNEGRCESKPTKKRTSRDEFEDSNRAPLYQAPPRRDSDGSVKAPPPPRRPSVSRRRRSSTDGRPKSRVSSAKVRVDDQETRASNYRKAAARRASLQFTHRTDSVEGDQVVPTNKTLSVDNRRTAFKPPPNARPTSPAVEEGGQDAREPSEAQKPDPAPRSADLPPPVAPDLTRGVNTVKLAAPQLPSKPPPTEAEGQPRTTRSHSIPADFLKRANTFAGHHRPSVRKNMNRHLEGQSWRREYAHSRPLPAHLSSKFVPMQMRTQPSNLPHGLKKSLSNVRVSDPGEVQLRHLDSAFTRSHQEGKKLSIETEIDRLAVGSRRVRDHRVERSADEIVSTAYRYSRPHADPRTAAASAR